MTVGELLVAIRLNVNDVTTPPEYSDAEVMRFVNDGISWLNNELTAVKDKDMMKELTIEDNAAVPADFNEFAGYPPVKIVGSNFKLLSTGMSVTVNYFAKKPFVTVATDTVPFDDRYTMLLIELASLYCLNRTNDDIEQDSKLVAMRRDIIRAKQQPVRWAR